MKNYNLFFVLNTVFLAIFVLIIIAIENDITQIILFSIGFLSAIIWDFHFFTIKYEISDNILTIKSGIIFKRTKTIPLEKAVLKSVYSVGKTVFLTIIRTAGSFAVVFGEL